MHTINLCPSFLHAGWPLGVYSRPIMHNRNIRQQRESTHKSPHMQIHTIQVSSVQNASCWSPWSHLAHNFVYIVGR